MGNPERDQISNKVVFSCLFIEEKSYILAYIKNFLLHTENNCYLYGNASKNITNSDIEYLNKISFRVYISVGSTERKKLGSTILVGHIENYENALIKESDFKYFCTTASNALFVKRFSLEAVEKKLCDREFTPPLTQRRYDNEVDVEREEISKKKGWFWPRLAETHGLIDYLSHKLNIKRFSVTQIEGMFTYKELWHKIYLFKEEVKNTEQFFLEEYNYIALEELIPSSIISESDCGRYTNICYMTWKHYKRISVNNLIKLQNILPKNVSIVKWFDRDIDSLPVLLVTSEWGVRLMDVISGMLSDNPSDLKVLSILEKSCNQFLLEEASPRHFGINVPEEYVCSVSAFFPEISANRAVIDIKSHDQNQKLDKKIFLFLEDNNDVQDISVNIKRSGLRTVIYYSVSGRQDLLLEQELFAYLYISVSSTNITFIADFIFYDLKRSFTEYSSGSYRLISEDQITPTGSVSKSRKIVKKIKLTSSDSDMYIGVPIYSNSADIIELIEIF